MSTVHPKAFQFVISTYGDIKGAENVCFGYEKNLWNIFLIQWIL